MWITRFGLLQNRAFFVNRRGSVRHAALLAMTIFAILPPLSERAVLAVEGGWLVGDGLQQALSNKVGVAWSNVAARRAIEEFSRTQRVAVVLDRRIDPDQKIELGFSEVPLAEAFQRIASRLDVGTAMVGPVVYFGPKSTTRRVATVAALANDSVLQPKGWTPTVRARWLQAKAWRWEDLATPRGLVEEAARENGIVVENPRQIPHDLWGAADLPPLPLATRLTLVLSQFDLALELAKEGNSIRLVPMPEKPVIERDYSVAGPAADAAVKLKKTELLSDAEVSVAGGKVVVRGRQEDQEIVSELLAGRTARRTTVSEGRKVYSMPRVDAPVSKLLETIGRQLNLEIQIDRPAIAGAGISLEKSVQVDVKDVTADQLLKAVLEPAGLTYERRGEVVEVKPR
jgi:hypothetical protein